MGRRGRKRWGHKGSMGVESSEGWNDVVITHLFVLLDSIFHRPFSSNFVVSLICTFWLWV
jgi:hypothetical protein